MFLAVVLVIGVHSEVGLPRNAEQPQSAGETAIDAPMDRLPKAAQQQGSDYMATEPFTENENQFSRKRPSLSLPHLLSLTLI